MRCLEIQWPRVHVPVPGHCLEAWRAAASPSACRSVLRVAVLQNQLLPAAIPAVGLDLETLLVSSSLSMTEKLHLLVHSCGSSPSMTPSYGREYLFAQSPVGPLFEPFYQASDWFPGLFSPRCLPPMSSLAPWLFNHSGSRLGHKKLARRRFVPLHPINTLAGSVTAVPVAVQVLPPGQEAWDEVLSVQ